MSVKPFLALAVAASFATPAFSQTVERCAANGAFGVTNAECTQFGGQITNGECVLSAEQLAAAREEICLSLPDNTVANGNISTVAAVFGVGGLLAAVAGGSSNTTTTTTTN